MSLKNTYVSQKEDDSSNDIIESLIPEGSALGSWNDRKPKFWKTIAGLLKAEYLMKIRDWECVGELIGALAFLLLLYPLSVVGKKKVKGSEQPPFQGPVNLTESLFPFFGLSGSQIVALPNCSRTRAFKSLFEKYIGTWVPVHIVNTVDEMRNQIYSSDSNAVGIEWENCDSLTASVSPKLNLYKQAIYGEPEEGFFSLFMNFWGPDYGIWITPELTPIDRQEYAQPDYEYTYDFQILVAFFMVAPAILATMPSLQSFLEMRDSKMLTLLELMGTSELQIWLTQFLVMEILVFSCYFLAAFMVCFGFMFKGTDFFLFLFLSLLFSFAHVFSSLLIQAICRDKKVGRILPIGLAIFAIFFGYIHYYYTTKTSNTAVKHILSILPLSAYQLVSLTLYERCKNKYPAFKWRDFTDNTLSYPLWMGAMWLAIDTGLYFLLWLLANTLLPRDFGPQPLRLREVFRFSAWRRFYGGGSISESTLGEMDSLEALSVENLRMRYPKTNKDAVDDVFFTLRRGEIDVMIGPNGAGKTSIIETIAGAIKKTTGRLFLFGEEAEQFREIHKYLGVCFQNNVLFDLLNVHEHFQLFGRIRGLPEAEVSEAEAFLYATLQLTGSKNSRTKDLSGGQKRKVCLSLALMGNPPLVFLDEPTAGVDVQARQLIWKTISSLKGSTCLITSHALEEAEAVSSRLFICAGGKLPFMGNATELRRQFNCGYLLRVEMENGRDIQKVLEKVMEFEPSAKIDEERGDVITMPINKAVSKILAALERQKEELGINSYNFSIEQLEDTLLKMIESEEAAHGPSPQYSL